MFATPILFIIYNRPGSTRQVFETIKNIRPKRLYVSADGPNDELCDEWKNCENARKIITEGVDWLCELKLLYHDRNLGCKTAVSSALDWFFKNEEEGIILEDDTLPNELFFLYCQDLLRLYRNDVRVWSISGFNFGLKADSFGQELVFGRMMNMWGWATWRRTFQKVDYDLFHLKQSSNKKLFTSQLLYPEIFQRDLDVNWVEYWNKMFNAVAEGTLDTWDFQWIYSQLRARMLTIYPSANLVQNIGFSEEATHTKNRDHQLARIESRSVAKWPSRKQKVKVTRDFENLYLKRVWCDVIAQKPAFKQLLLLKLRQTKMRLLAKLT